MASKLTSTILKQANEIEDVNERANWLRENATYAVRGLLNFNFHPTVKFLLPEGEPDLEGLAIKREAEDYVLGTEFSHLNAEMKKMYLFYEGGHATLTQQKRESLWVNLITGLHTEERDDLTKMKDKKLQEKYPNIIKEIRGRGLLIGIRLHKDQEKFIHKLNPSQISNFALCFHNSIA